MNTHVPEQHLRPLITSRFDSAVDRVTPSQDKQAAVVAIDLREGVSYSAEQVGNVIRVNFADSAIPPKPYEDAQPPAWKAGAAPIPEGRPMPAYEPMPAKGAAASKTVAVAKVGLCGGNRLQGEGEGVHGRENRPGFLRYRHQERFPDPPGDQRQELCNRQGRHRQGHPGAPKTGPVGSGARPRAEDESVGRDSGGRHPPGCLSGHTAAGRKNAPGPAQGRAGFQETGGGRRTARYRVPPGQLLHRQDRGPAPSEHDQHKGPRQDQRR